VTVLIQNDFGEARDLAHGLVSGSLVTERWSIHPEDPLSAISEIVWEQTGGRGEWRTRTVAEMRMRCDAHSFFLSGRLAAWNDGEMIFDRDYEDAIARRFV
jgi:hypothetical protein